MLEVPATLDRSQGDLHALGNPHFLADPLNGQRVAAHLAEAFCRLDPDGGAQYRSNVTAFARQVEARVADWQRLLAPFAGQRVVSYHNSWPYFAQRFGLRLDLFLEPKPGLPPSPAHLAAVIRTMQTEHVPVILVEPHISRRTAETVARSSGAALVEVCQFPGGLKGTEGDYLGTLDQVVRALARALGDRAAAGTTGRPGP
jgi:ABC-type Zn uptake system ZnuABC Zn-binding protein ZnuA